MNKKLLCIGTVLAAVTLLLGGIAAAEDPDCESHMDVTAEVPFACEVDFTLDSCDLGCIRPDECVTKDPASWMSAKTNCKWQIMVEDNSIPPHGGCMYDPDKDVTLETPLDVRVNCHGWFPMNGEPGGVLITTDPLFRTGEDGIRMPIKFRQCVTWDDVCGDYEIVVTFIVMPAP